MASPENVKRYLAYWFQLGKKVIIKNGDEAVLPQSVLNGHCYSDEFEKCWQIVTDLQNKDCYLEGTSQTIQELLSSRWAITPCARCEMPVAMIDLGIQGALCACDDLDNWPNNELPPPRAPIDSQEIIEEIRDSLNKKIKEKETNQMPKINDEGDNQDLHINTDLKKSLRLLTNKISQNN
jgi:hypothetical protein